ncbi:GNAT family N-acetyltransferase [Pseudodonghicola flavimaris]|uniref:GNAT family N-acetyltransferase n=1 Tax=Pseudodonghicola flavimaris TaxID=3050036 RepID=A0ABT7F5Q4_9RHOB|nr:GNAT family N-acetyltransferase [Pseudodonghicola flavimaris]MDK3019935.1 GNAT family N-acetyltransferase [Pseudodonghicola flavimaris]
MNDVRLRTATRDDDDAIWAMLEPVIRGGETYALPRDMPRAAALEYWFLPGHSVQLAEAGGEILGTYYLCANQKGGGAHVCNCGYVTAAEAQGRGIARAMLADSLTRAKDAGFRAMQYNFVISTNNRAIDTWCRAGFEIVGRLPGAFQHPRDGYVDALVMFRPL